MNDIKKTNYINKFTDDEILDIAKKLGVPIYEKKAFQDSFVKREKDKVLIGSFYAFYFLHDLDENFLELNDFKILYHAKTENYFLKNQKITKEETELYRTLMTEKFGENYLNDLQKFLNHEKFNESDREI